jgi:hypothetical protein
MKHLVFESNGRAPGVVPFLLRTSLQAAARTIRRRIASRYAP